MTPPAFYVDETYGPRLVGLLRQMNLHAVTYRDVRAIESGDRAVDWILNVAARRWIAVTGDKKTPAQAGRAPGDTECPAASGGSRHPSVNRGRGCPCDRQASKIGPGPRSPHARAVRHFTYPPTPSVSPGLETSKREGSNRGCTPCDTHQLA